MFMSVHSSIGEGKSDSVEAEQEGKNSGVLWLGLVGGTLQFVFHAKIGHLSSVLVGFMNSCS